MKKLLLPLIALWLLSLPAHAVLDGDCDYTTGSTTTATGFANCAEEITETEKRDPIATTSTNSSNDIIATRVYLGAATALREGLLIYIDSPVTISGASNINLDGTGLKGTVGPDGVALGSGDLVLGTRYYFSYKASTSKWMLVGPTGTATGALAAPFVTVGNTALLANERAIAAGTGLGLTDGGANSTVTLNITDAELACILAQTSAADKISYWTGSGTCALADFSSAERTYLTTSSIGNLAAVLTDEATGWATFQTTPTVANLGAFLTNEAAGWATFVVTPSAANLAAFLTDEAAGWATFQTTPSMANLGSFLSDDAAGWTTFGTTPTSANLGALLTNELDSAAKVLLFLGAPADDQVAVGDSATATTWRAIPDISATQKLSYATATNTFSAATDDDVPEVGDFAALVGGAGITNSAGTLSLDATEINSIVWGSGTFTTQTFDAGATDPTWTYASNGLGITNAATFVHGNATSLTTNGVAGQVQIDGTTSALGSLNINEFNTTDATAFGLNFFKSGDAAIGVGTVVASGEDLGRLTWYGAQQTGTFATQNQAAGIRATVGGTVTSGAGADMPGNLIFCTTPDASGTCTDRLTIDAAGLTTFTGSITVGANNVTATNVELANGTANTLTAAAGVLSVEGVTQVPSTRTLTAGTGIATLGDLSANRTVAFDYSDAGASPALNVDECRFTGDATTNGEMVCEGDTADTIETRINITDPTASDKTFTIPNADSTAIQTLTCSNTDRISAVSALGVITCSHIVESLCVAASDETTSITTGTAKVTFRMPYAFTLTNIRGSLNTVSSSGSPIIDVNEAGTTLMTANKVLIDVSELTSVTAVTAVTLTDTSLADDASMTIDVDTAGTGAKGLKICLIGYQT